MKRLYKLVSATCTALMIYNVVFANNSVTDTVYNNSYNNKNTDSVTEFVYNASFLEYLNNISVSFTNNIKIKLDPYQINEKDQIISNDIIIENTGEFPISINLKKCNIEIDNKSEIVFTPDSYLNPDSNLKEAYLYIYEDGESKFNKISDGDMNMDFGVLEKGEKKILKIGGELNTNGVIWTNDDKFDIQFIFKFDTLEDINQETVSSFVYN